MTRIFGTALAALTAFAVTAAAAGDGEITRVAGDVYRFQNKFHYSLVTVTDDGVVVVDPINAQAAARLKEALKAITAKPITHLIYSHSHADHASGGAVLGAPTVIAQQNAPEKIDGVAPTMRFTDEKTLEIGGKTFELTWLGEGHGDDLIVVIVRPENVAFITDVSAPRRLPYRTLPSSSIDAWINQVRKIETLDFQIFAPAHGEVGDKSANGEVLTYLETLRAEVLAGLEAGKSVAELQSSVTLDAYKDWGQYDAWRALNVQGMAEYLIRSGKVN